jgi:hypothetical protein
MIIPDSRKRWAPKRSRPEIWPGTGNAGGWLPVSISSGAMPVVRWIDARGLRLDEPFFAQTVNSLRDGERPPLECETELSALERAAGSRSVMPSGIIVHVTRCGSTLLTNALRAAEHSVVLSEPQIFGRVLGWVGSPAPYWARVGLDLVRQVSAVFAHYQGNDVSQPVILKCGADGLFLLRAIRAALPMVPCLVLVRDPAEVLVSIAALTPVSFVEWYDSAHIPRFGIPPPEILAQGHVEFWAWIMGRFCSDALTLLGPRCRVLDYSQITLGLVRKVGEFFNLSFSVEGERSLSEIFRLDAKRPGRVFESDSADKRMRASETIRASCGRWADDPYRQLRTGAAAWNDL